MQKSITALLIFHSIWAYPQSSPQLIFPLAHNSQITSYCVSNDNKFLLTANENEQKVIIWETASGKQTAELNEFNLGIDKLIMSPKGSYFIVAERSGNLKAFNFPSLQKRWEKNTKRISDVRFICRGTRLMVNYLLVSEENGHDQKDTKQFTYIIDDSTGVIMNKNGQDIFDLKTNNKITTVKIFPFIENKESAENDIRFFDRRDNSCIFLTSSNLIKYDENGTIRYSTTTGANRIDDFFLSQERKFLQISSKNEISMFDLGTGRKIMERNLGHSDFRSGKGLYSMSVSPDERKLIYQNRIFTLPKFELFQTLNGDADCYTHFISNASIVRFGLYPMAYTLKKETVEDMSNVNSDAEEIIDVFSENSSVPSHEITNAVFIKNELELTIDHSDLINLRLNDCRTNLKSKLSPFRELEEEEERDDFILMENKYIQPQPGDLKYKIFINNLRNSLIFKSGNAQDKVTYKAEPGYNIQEIISLRDPDMFLIRLYGDLYDKKNKSKVISFSLKEKMVLNEFVADKVILEMKAERNTDVVILNEYNETLHILNAQNFKVIKKASIKNITNKVGWFNSYNLSIKENLAVFHTHSTNTISHSTTVVLYEWETNKILDELTVPFNIESLSFSPDMGVCYFITKSEMIAWDMLLKKELFHYLPLSDANWIVYDKDFRYDGTPAAIEKIYFTCGLKIIESPESKIALRVPGLANKILNKQAIYGKRLSEIPTCHQ